MQDIFSSLYALHLGLKTQSAEFWVAVEAPYSSLHSSAPICYKPSFKKKHMSLIN